MTKEEITKAADESIKNFRTVHVGNLKLSPRTVKYNSTQCAILHYEKIVELLTLMSGTIESDFVSVEIRFPILEYSKAIITELKSRL